MRFSIASCNDLVDQRSYQMSTVRPTGVEGSESSSTLRLDRVVVVAGFSGVTARSRASVLMRAERRMLEARWLACYGVMEYLGNDKEIFESAIVEVRRTCFWRALH